MSVNRWGLLLLFVGMGLFVHPVFAADVVINEFLAEPSNSQWVELYNTGSSSQDISGWVIDDGGSPSSKYSIPSNTQLPAGACLVFSSGSFYFNTASSDSAQLISDTTVIDQYAYSKSSGSGVSFGRSPDGTGGWTTFMSPSPGSLNSTGDPCLPAATPTPAPTSTPTSTPAPTVTPTRTPTQTPTKTPTPTVKPTATATPRPSLTASVSAVLGATDSPEIASVEADTKTKPSVKPLVISLLFVGIGCAILSLVFVWKKRNASILEE